MKIKYTLALRPAGTLTDAPAPVVPITETVTVPDHWTEIQIEMAYNNWVSNHIDGTWEKVSS